MPPVQAELVHKAAGDQLTASIGQIAGGIEGFHTGVDKGVGRVTDTPFFESFWVKTGRRRALANAGKGK